MIGTMPTFYSIHITTELVNAVNADCIDQFSGDGNTIEGWHGPDHCNSRDDGIGKGFQSKMNPFSCRIISGLACVIVPQTQKRRVGCGVRCRG